jgi:hypothetical protein
VEHFGLPSLVRVGRQSEPGGTITKRRLVSDGTDAVAANAIEAALRTGKES